MKEINIVNWSSFAALHMLDYVSCTAVDYITTHHYHNNS